MLKTMWKAAMGARNLNKNGVEEVLVIGKNDFREILTEREWLTKNYQHAYDCIEDMGAGFSRCRYCLERESCHDKRKGNLRGCPEWVLSYPKEEENEQAAETEDRATEPENQAAPVQDNDEGTADGRACEERDNPGGSEERLEKGI